MCYFMCLEELTITCRRLTSPSLNFNVAIPLKLHFNIKILLWFAAPKVRRYITELSKSAELEC